MTVIANSNVGVHCTNGKGKVSVCFSILLAEGGNTTSPQARIQKLIHEIRSSGAAAKQMKIKKAATNASELSSVSLYVLTKHFAIHF